MTVLQKSVKAHPFAALGLFCLLLAAVFDQTGQSLFTPLAPYLIGAAALGFLVFWALPSLRRVGIVVLTTALVLVGCAILANARHPAVILLVIGSVALAAVAFALWLLKKLTCRAGVALLLAAGFLLRLCYVLYTSVALRQHDVWFFSDGSFTAFHDQRHAEYIEYIATYLKLPAVDPTRQGLSQLYHPPLHHLLAGLWLRLNVTLGLPYASACENIQLLTLFYSAAGMLIAYRIFRELKIAGGAMVVVMALLCFHPTFILMAGSVNNDILSITLALAAILAAIRWFKKPGFGAIIAVAVWLGLSMMTKLSGALIAPAIAVVFLWKWVSSMRARDGAAGNLLLQFAVFGAICVPLGLWWPVKNALTYHMPLTYVPALSANSDQYVGGYSLTRRLLELPPESLRRVFVAWQNEEYASSYNEYNLFLGLLKTAVFGEFTLFNPDANPGSSLHAAGNGAALVLFYGNAALVALSLYAMARVPLQKKHRLSGGHTVFFVLIWAVVLISYVQFCFQFPQTCTQNFRYAVPTLLCGCVFLGKAFQGGRAVFRTLLCACTAVFCLSALACYLLLGLVPA